MVGAAEMFVTQRMNLDYDLRSSFNQFSSLLEINFARVIGSAKN